MALEGRLPVRRRERRREKISGSLSMKGVWSGEDETASDMREKKVLGPAEVRVCLVVWKSWPPTSMVTMLESDLGWN